MVSTLKKAEPTQEDFIAAAGCITQAPYPKQRLADEDELTRAYRDLYAQLMCRERQLEMALALLSEKDRERIGA